ncbi:hypothetical protein PVAP13_5NG349381 [Panicum virgatum]|uniref:Uncharacterized protein n=1 Tax=Panicum virgatum TaxID=38727 RepID=A0A8T0RTU6_PANVG|nr:hypothetical protein PVAP13_5NG349381 [Panicum virgatum]
MFDNAECFQGFFSAKDFDKNASPHFQKADKFYDALARQLSKSILRTWLILLELIRNMFTSAAA